MGFEWENRQHPHDGMWAALYYSNRRQGPPAYADNPSDLVAALKDQKQRMIHECGKASEFMYPDNNAWEVRIAIP